MTLSVTNQEHSAGDAIPSKCAVIEVHVGELKQLFDAIGPSPFRESLTIGSWVSMWRPLEVFLYDWWPIRKEARLSDRLAVMPVRIRYANATGPDAWRADWPVVSPRGERKTTAG